MLQRLDQNRPFSQKHKDGEMIRKEGEESRNSRPPARCVPTYLADVLGRRLAAPRAGSLDLRLNVEVLCIKTAALQSKMREMKGELVFILNRTKLSD